MRISQRTAWMIACAMAAYGAAAGPAIAQRSNNAAAMAQVRQPTPPYRINAGDDLEIYVWGEERLQRTVRVLPDGTFAFPLVGQVMAQGKLPLDLEKIISDRLKDQYRGQVPQVTVSVKSPNGTQFAVMGRVKSPGNFTPSRYVTLLDALSLAGGPAEFANLDAILIIRKDGDQLRTMRVRLAQLFKSGAGDDDVQRGALRIEPGDTIIVP